MAITIVNKNALETRLKDAATVWQLYYKKSIRTILIHYAIGLVFLAEGFYGNSGYDMIRTNSVFAEKANNLYYNLHFVISIGIVYLVFTTINFIRLLRSKKKMVDASRAGANQYFKASNETTTIITDEGISYHHQLMDYTMKWAAFSYYKIYNDTIFINSANSLSSAISFHRNELTDKEFAEFETFVKSRLAPVTGF